jgi:D-alanyl-D-alanine carboxypeptidase
LKISGLIGAVVIGASLVLAAIAFALVSALLREAEESGPAALAARLERELAAQGDEIASLRAELARLAARIEAIEARPMPAPGAAVAPPDLAALPSEGYEGEGPAPQTAAMIEQMELAKTRFNRSIERPRPGFLRELLGEPRASYSQDCQPVTNPRLVDALETRAVGNFRLTMLRPALDSFERVMARLQAEEPDIFAALGTAGALCVRLVRGSTNSISSHAWGIAVDLTLQGDLDRMGDGGTQFGLVVLAEFFNDEGWYWGAGYGREDSMHFEVGEARLREWVLEGRI